MPAYFLDSSGLVKRYVSETGTAWIRTLCASASVGSLSIAAIAGVETVAAISNRVRRGATTAGDAAIAISALKYHLVSDYTRADLSEPVFQYAMDLAEKHGLRGYDAVQLAAALQVSSERLSYGLAAPIFISADTNLNAAATAEGLAVEDPNTHP